MVTFVPPSETHSQRPKAAPWPSITAAGYFVEGKDSMLHLFEPSTACTAAPPTKELFSSVSF